MRRYFYKYHLWFVSALCTILILFYYWYSKHLPIHMPQLPVIDINTTNICIDKIPKLKIILVWDDLFGKKNWGFKHFSTESFTERACKEINCVVTDDKNLLPIADAVYFHGFSGDKTMPHEKYPGQIWVMLSHEPPYKLHLNQYDNLINWTQGYKTTSDVYMPYLYYCFREKPIKINFTQVIKSKRKKIAWFCSNCNAPSRRNEYVRELMKYIQVDVYGKCSRLFNQNNVCTRNNEKQCYDMLERDYKFYLSFESCFHDGYVTEKYYNILNYNVVPIVRGGGNYSEIAIPKSYISTNDFRTPKELAEYLLELDKNDEKYIEYLKYKEIYRIDYNDPACKMKDGGFCLFCEMLNNNKIPNKVYENMAKWYGKCKKPSDI